MICHLVLWFTSIHLYFVSKRFYVRFLPKAKHEPHYYGKPTSPSLRKEKKQLLISSVSVFLKLFSFSFPLFVFNIFSFSFPTTQFSNEGYGNMVNVYSCPVYLYM